MSNTTFEQLATIIKSRRSTGWAKMNGKAIPDTQVNEILELANWAPTHAKTEPWRFYVYGGEALKKFGKDHADLYWNNTDEDKRQQATYDKLEHNVDLASHVIVAVMKRGSNDKIPKLEELAAASAAVQNVLLGATALGIASFWSTGGMTLKPALKQYLELGAEDEVLGLISLGYTDEPAKEGVRNTPAAEKVKWL
jgi:nitroreductase